MVSSTDQETNEIESQEPKLRSPEIQQSEKSEEIAPDVIEPQPNRSDGEGKSRPLTSPRDHLVGSGEEELPTPSLSMKGWRLYVLTFGYFYLVPLLHRINPLNLCINCDYNTKQAMSISPPLHPRNNNRVDLSRLHHQ